MPGNKQISELTPTTVINNNDLFAIEQDAEAKSIAGRHLVAGLAAALDGHGGVSSWELYSTSSTNPVVKTYRVTMTDGTYFDIAIPDGATGPRGSNGASVTITAAEVKYAIGSSGTVAPVSGWTAAVPAASPGDYLWTRTTVTYSGPVTTTTYSVSYIGANGVSYYVHVRYADNEPARDADVLTTPSAWMGVYTGPSETAPTAYTAYAWNHVRGGDYYTYIRYADDVPASDADMYAVPTVNTVYMGVYTGPGATAPTAYTAYTWVQIRGPAGQTVTVTRVSVEYAYSSNGNQHPSTFYASAAAAATAYGASIQGTYLWLRLGMVLSNNMALSPFYFPVYQGLDGDSIAGLGTVYTAAWIPSETSASLTPLTDTLTLPAGTYMIVATSPTCSAPVPVELRGAVNSQYWLMDSRESFTFVREFASETSVHLATAGSASATFTNTAQGGLKAVRLK